MEEKHQQAQQEHVALSLASLPGLPGFSNPLVQGGPGLDGM